MRPYTDILRDCDAAMARRVFICEAPDCGYVAGSLDGFCGLCSRDCLREIVPDQLAAIQLLTAPVAGGVQ